MDKDTVLFVSERPLERAENINAVFSAYKGKKVFLQWNGSMSKNIIKKSGSKLMVTDEFPMTSPGKVIMIGHGIDGGKTYGFDQPAPYINKSTVKLIDYFITSGVGTVQMAARCSGLDVQKVLPYGVARTDAYVGKRIGDGHTMLNQYWSYLYVPTFRNRGETSLPEIDWDRIDYELRDNEMFFIKVHPKSKPMPKKRYRHIIQIDPSEPSMPYLIDCSVVITDYSTIMFDGYLLNKPCVLFEKKKGYTETRGMYFQYPDFYSSRYAQNEIDLIRECRMAEKLTDIEKRVIRQVADGCDGHATERICMLIEKVLKGE